MSFICDVCANVVKSGTPLVKIMEEKRPRTYSNTVTKKTMDDKGEIQFSKEVVVSEGWEVGRELKTCPHGAEYQPGEGCPYARPRGLS